MLRLAEKSANKEDLKRQYKEKKAVVDKADKEFYAMKQRGVTLSIGLGVLYDSKAAFYKGCLPLIRNACAAAALSSRVCHYLVKKGLLKRNEGTYAGLRAPVYEPVVLPVPEKAASGGCLAIRDGSAADDGEGAGDDDGAEGADNGDTGRRLDDMEVDHEGSPDGPDPTTGLFPNQLLREGLHSVMKICSTTSAPDSDSVFTDASEEAFTDASEEIPLLFFDLDDNQWAVADSVPTAVSSSVPLFAEGNHTMAPKMNKAKAKASPKRKGTKAKNKDVGAPPAGDQGAAAPAEGEGSGEGAPPPAGDNKQEASAPADVDQHQPAVAAAAEGEAALVEEKKASGMKRASAKAEPAADGNKPAMKRMRKKNVRADGEADGDEVPAAAVDAQNNASGSGQNVVGGAASLSGLQQPGAFDDVVREALMKQKETAGSPASGAQGEVSAVYWSMLSIIAGTQILTSTA